MSTALVLMNRLRAKAREEQVTAFGSDDDRHIALISELNQAARIVLEERTWNFQHKSDGSLIMRQLYNDTTGTAVTVGTGITLTLGTTVPESDDYAGTFVTSVVLTGNTNYGNTAFDLSVCRVAGAAIGGTLPTMPFGTLSSTGWLLFVYQYGLPATVRQITEIWHQEENIEIYQESEHDFRQLIPRPHEDHGSMPRVAFLGGTITPTAATTALAASATELSAIRIWPVPGTREMLHYRYIKRYSDLVLETDGFNGVPLFAEDLIVQLAYARQLQSIQSDIQRGSLMESNVMREIELKHRNNRFDPKRSRQLQSLDEIGAKRSGLLRTYDTVPGWP